ncbi:MAG: phosphatase PAP2 family protein [Proteobacteria bacterium]|nr:phosphatase PAP2 family protein [Pseudomonadota bacterium]
MTYTQIQWGILLFAVLIVGVWIHSSSFVIIYDKKILYFSGFLSAFLLLLYIFYIKFRPIPEIVILLQSLFVLQFYTPLMVILSYLACTANYPFIDSTLASFENYLGFNSSILVLWFRGHELWQTIFHCIYQSYYYQEIAIIIYFTYQRKALHLQRFLTQFMIAASVTSLISTFLPAEGPYVWYDYTPSPSLANSLSHLLELRQQIVNIIKIDGVTTFPSFHTIMALIYAYCFRFERKLIFIPVLILNLLIVFSCLPIGQHYLADIVGAIPVFLAIIYLEKLIFKCAAFSQAKNQEKIKKLSESSFGESYRQ